MRVYCFNNKYNKCSFSEYNSSHNNYDGKDKVIIEISLFCHTVEQRPFPDTTIPDKSQSIRNVAIQQFNPLLANR